MASFLPLFFLTGIEGRMLVPLGISFIVALIASTIVALTVTPVLCLTPCPAMVQRVWHLEFRDVYAQGVLVKFGSAPLAGPPPPSLWR